MFVGNPLVPATNNASERRLRYLVISPTISGGAQSPKGTQTKMTLVSLSATWRLQNLEPLATAVQRRGGEASNLPPHPRGENHSPTFHT